MMIQKTCTFLFMCLCLSLQAQEVIKLPFEQPAAVQWEGDEKAYFSNIWQTKVVTNVSEPTMQVFKAEGDNRTDVAVVIAPGGGLYAHSIESEGTQVAQWLQARGITAFVLKYRLVPTGKDGVAEISQQSQQNQMKIMEEVGKVLPYSVRDALQAIAYARTHASDYGIDPDKIGITGFSAGGAVTIGVANFYTKANRPDFLIPVYAWTDVITLQRPREDAPPMLLICASDDPFGLASGSILLYNTWFNGGKSVGLHMYAKGGHGFGMHQKGNPSDTWIERVHEWLGSEGFLGN